MSHYSPSFQSPGEIEEAALVASIVTDLYIAGRGSRERMQSVLAATAMACELMRKLHDFSVTDQDTAMSDLMRRLDRHTDPEI